MASLAGVMASAGISADVKLISQAESTNRWKLRAIRTERPRSEAAAASDAELFTTCRRRNHAHREVKTRVGKK
jgi:hypothetical protein